MHYSLYIDTSNNKLIKVSIKNRDTQTALDQPLEKTKAQAVLNLINELLIKQNITLKDIGGIYVNQGPGSFTGIRVGITVANTLALLLKIPVNDKPVGIFAEPEYT